MIKEFNFSKAIDMTNDKYFTVMNEMLTIAVNEIAYNQDKVLYNMLYEEFLKNEKSSRCTAYILNKDEFKRFINKYLPIYMAEKESD